MQDWVYSELVELLKLFKGKKILVVGDLMLDKYVSGEVIRISPEAPVPVLRVNSSSKKDSALGGAGNVAKNIATLGGTAYLVGLLGRDDAAREFNDLATQAGLILKQVSSNRWVTNIKTRYLEHRGHHLLRVDEEETSILTPQIEDLLVRRCAEILPMVQGVLVSDYAKGVLTPLLAEVLIERTRGLKIPLLADVKPKNISYMRGASMISPNADEARAYLNSNAKTPLEEVALKISLEFNTTAFLTAGDQGIYVSVQGGPTLLVPQHHKVQVQDVSGCGDTAAAVILLAKLCGVSNERAAFLANAAAAVVAGKIGAVAPTPKEISRMLKP